MKSVLLIIVFLAGTVGESFGIAKIGVYADPTGSNCHLVDTQVGPVSYYVVVTGENTAAVSFAAPMPACMIGTTWISDTPVYPITLGDSQSGTDIGFGACFGSPNHVLTMNYVVGGQTEVCCCYPVLPSPTNPSGCVDIVLCAGPVFCYTGEISLINSSEECPTCDHCLTVSAESTSWGRVKALFVE